MFINVHGFGQGCRLIIVIILFVVIFFSVLHHFLVSFNVLLVHMKGFSLVWMK